MTQPAPITINYWEGNEKEPPITALYYCEWTCNGRSYYAWADESKFNYGEDTISDELPQPDENIQVRGIPLEVRRALAELIFPPLKDMSNEI